MKKLTLILTLLVLPLTALADSPRPIHKQKIVDLTWTLDETTIAWPTSPGFELETQFEGESEAGFYYLSHLLHAPEHGGTHIDAPRHFFETSDTTDQIPLERLIGPGVRVDVQKVCKKDRDHLISVADLRGWEEKHGRIPDGAIVLLHTGFGRYWPDRERYMGTAELGADAVAKLSFPGIDAAAAKWLVAERKVRAVGLDTPSIDRGKSTTFESHVVFASNNVPSFENVAHLEKLPAKSFTVIALPAKIGGGSGGPLRIIALIN